MTEENIELAIIGGSGFYDIEGLEEKREEKVKTPFGKPSAGILTGVLDGLPMAFLPRHGIGHSIIPSEINYRANIYALKKIGVKRILSVSAVGSMKEEIAPGDFVVVDQFFDHSKKRESSFFSSGLVAHISFSDPVCGALNKQLLKALDSLGVKRHEGGTYICMEGPQFSTRGESLIYRKWGVDVIGMTAMPEAKLAREASICYSTLALATDYDCWRTGDEPVSAEMVVKQQKENIKNARKAVVALAGIIKKNLKQECNCPKALRGAIQTAPEAIDEKLKKKLDVIVKDYI
ncbi:MAG: S-methyl-5'-thioadenosine phosphorylase [Elusimicrobiota bacterium]